MPAGLMHAGANWIAVRITDTGGGEGFHGDAAAGSVPLAGMWHGRVEQVSMAGEPTATTRLRWPTVVSSHR